MKQKISANTRGFTLVELLVTMTIIATLATIAFFSFGEAAMEGRNTSRKTDMGEMKIRLRGIRQKVGSYPYPASYFSLVNSGSLAAYQGDTSSIENDSGGSFRIDPQSKKSYLYSTTKNRQSFQIGMTLEGNPKPTAYLDGDYIALAPNVFPSLFLAATFSGALEVHDLVGSGSTNRLMFIVHNGTQNLPYSTSSGFPVFTATSFTGITEESGVIIPKSSNYSDCKAIYEGGKSMGPADYIILTSTGMLTSTGCLMEPPNY